MGATLVVHALLRAGSTPALLSWQAASSADAVAGWRAADDAAAWLASGVATERLGLLSRSFCAQVVQPLLTRLRRA